MGKITLKYEDLLKNSQGVEIAINNLLTIVENINTKCKSFNNGEIWSGSVATAFNATTDKLNKFSQNTILDFKETNEFKKTAISSFKENELLISNLILSGTPLISPKLGISSKKNEGSSVTPEIKKIGSNNRNETPTRTTIGSTTATSGNSSVTKSTGSVANNDSANTNTTSSVSGYKSNSSKGFTVTNDNKKYSLSDDDIELFMAVVASEACNSSKDDCLAVASVILNRCEASNWVASHGSDPIAQIKAPGQFEGYFNGHYKKFMNGNVNENVRTAVYDALNGVRNCDYLSFRSSGTTSYSDNMIHEKGNRYK